MGLVVDYSAVGREIAIGERFAVKRRIGRFFVSGQWFSVVMNRIYEMKPEMTGKYTDIIRLSWIFTGDFCLLTKILKSCPCHLSYDSLDMLPARIRWASEREETQRSFFNIWSYRFDRNSLAGFCLDQVAWTYYCWWFMNLLNEITPILPCFQDGILWNQVYCMAVKVFCKVFWLFLLVWMMRDVSRDSGRLYLFWVWCFFVRKG